MALSSTSKIIVDDADSRIQYSQHWFADDSGKTNDLGNFGPTFRSTLHGVNRTSSLRFDFIGTSVDLFGTTDTRQHRGSADPTCECFIDGISIGAVDPFKFAENNWRLCGAPNLKEGAHTLTVNVISRGQTFWVDYVAFTPSTIVSTSNEVYQVQDTDPRIQYDSNWQLFAGMTHLASQKGSSVSFSFFGSQLTWIGIIPGETTLSQTPALASYSLDGSTTVPFALPALPQESSTEYNHRLFTTPVVQNGLHNITVTYEGEQPSTPLTLDYLLIQNGTGLPGATSTLKPIVQAPSTSPQGFPPSDSAALSNNKGKGINIPAVVGGLIGAFALLLICGIIYRYVLNRESPPGRKASPNKIQPFVQPPPPMAQIQRQPTPDSRSLTSNRSPDDPFRTEIRDIVPETITVRQPQPKRNQRPLSRPVGERPRETRQSMVPPNSPAQAGASSSSDPALSSRADEDYSYYGGYQTWAQTKALEAEASDGLKRDSYM